MNTCKKKTWMEGQCLNRIILTTISGSNCLKLGSGFGVGLRYSNKSFASEIIINM